MRKILSASLALAVLVGCAARGPGNSAPYVTDFPEEGQNQLEAGAHWGSVANDMVEQIANAIPKDSTVYVVAPRQQSDFTQAFHNQMISALVNKGLYVSKVYDSQAIIIDIDTQMVRQRAYYNQNTPRRELVVTASASRNGQYIARRTSVYYVADNGGLPYHNLNKNIAVKGDH